MGELIEAGETFADRRQRIRLAKAQDDRNTDALARIWLNSLLADDGVNIWPIDARPVRDPDAD